ncbi:hypothetical protein D3C87_279350 [compost metagenome]
METPYIHCCPECGERKRKMLVNTEFWFECKACGYAEDSYKGPVSLVPKVEGSKLVQFIGIRE